MHAGRRYGLKEFLIWTRRDIYLVLLLAVIPVLLYEMLDWKWLAIPWVPIALVGTAAAFIVGFRNNATYDRLWEGRQIWGGIINSSRAWGLLVKSFVTGKQEQQQLIYRHLAWLAALRFQLREPRTWENMGKSYNLEHQRKFFTVPEREGKLTDELPKYLSPEEQAFVLGKRNRATHIISLQSEQLRTLSENGTLELFRYLELGKMLVDLYDQQGKCERLKNFPYPRQFATLNLFFIRLFIFMVPFGMLQEFGKLGDHFVWLGVPFSALVSWVFLSMEKIGESTENPFEGGANDVPITALSRTIEIDLREMLDEQDIPPALQPVNKILM